MTLDELEWTGTGEYFRYAKVGRYAIQQSVKDHPAGAYVSNLYWVWPNESGEPFLYAGVDALTFQCVLHHLTSKVTP